MKCNIFVEAVSSINIYGRREQKESGRTLQTKRRAGINADLQDKK